MWEWSDFGLDLRAPEYYRNIFQDIEIKQADTYSIHGYALQDGIVSPKLWINIEDEKTKHVDWANYAHQFTGFYELPKPVIRPECALDILNIIKKHFSSDSVAEITLENPTTFKMDGKRMSTEWIEHILAQQPPQIIKGGYNNRYLKHNIKAHPLTMILRVLPIPCMDVRPTFQIDWHETKPVRGEPMGRVIPSIVKINELGDERFGGVVFDIDNKEAQPITTSEDDLTYKLVDIIRISERLKQAQKEIKPCEECSEKECIKPISALGYAGTERCFCTCHDDGDIITDLWELLQYHITTYFNNNTPGIPPAKHRSGLPLKSIATRLEYTQNHPESDYFLIHSTLISERYHSIMTVPETGVEYNPNESLQTPRKMKEKVGFREVKGLKPLVKWLRGMGKRFTPEGIERFDNYPTGVLLTGVPGCGKSMIAKAVSSEWGLEYKRYMPDQLIGPAVSDNERAMRRMLEELEEMAPVVCFIDEAEKFLAQTTRTATYGAADAGRDASESILLQFMNDNNSGVFFIFTANDYDKMSPAMIDRFDERWFIDLPSYSGRFDIIKSQLKSRRKVDTDIDIDKLANLSDGFSGRDINFSITEAEMDAFIDDNRNLTYIDLEKSFKTRKATSTMHGEAIAKLRNAVSEGKLRSANTEPIDGKNQPTVNDVSYG